MQDFISYANIVIWLSQPLYKTLQLLFREVGYL